MTSRGYGATGTLPLKKGKASASDDGDSTNDTRKIKNNDIFFHGGKIGQQYPYEVLRAYQPHPSSAQSFQDYSKNNGSASLSSASSSIHSMIYERQDARARDPNETLISVVVRYL